METTTEHLDHYSPSPGQIRNRHLQIQVRILEASANLLFQYDVLCLPALPFLSEIVNRDGNVLKFLKNTTQIKTCKTFIDALSFHVTKDTYLCVCVCVCVCARARARAHVCVCVSIYIYIYISSRDILPLSIRRNIRRHIEGGGISKYFIIWNFPSQSIVVVRRYTGSFQHAATHYTAFKLISVRLKCRVYIAV